MMFSGKTLLITGGSRGIGKKICFEFAKRGCNIIFTYVRSSSESKKIESELLKFGVNVISKKLNLNSNDDIKKFVENIKNLDIKIDFLINNAASGVMKNSIETTEKHWDWTMQINAKGPWILSKSISKLMPSKSRIINISSPGSTKVLNNYLNNYDNYVSIDYSKFKEKSEHIFQILNSINHKNLYSIYPHKIFCNKNKCIGHDKNDIF